MGDVEVVEVVDLENLEKLAKAATAGPWEKVEKHGFLFIRAVNEVEPLPQGHILGSHYRPQILAEDEYTTRMADHDYVAAANPAAILSLLKQIEIAKNVACADLWDQLAQQLQVILTSSELLMADQPTEGWREDAQRIQKAVRNIVKIRDGVTGHSSKA